MQPVTDINGKLYHINLEKIELLEIKEENVDLYVAQHRITITKVIAHRLGLITEQEKTN